MFFRPWLNLIIPSNDPRVLPKVEPEFPLSRFSHHLVLNFYFYMKRSFLFLIFHHHLSSIITCCRSFRNVKRKPNGPYCLTRKVESFKCFKAVRHEIGSIIVSHVTAGIGGSIVGIREAVTNQVQ